MIKDLLAKYKDVFPYVFWGALTTLINMIAYWICAHLLMLPVIPSTIVAWILAVQFAYQSNRKWVFHSVAEPQRDILKEICSFYAARAATGALDLLCMYVFVDALHWNGMLVKAFANALVISLNYIISKFWIFR